MDLTSQMATPPSPRAHRDDTGTIVLPRPGTPGDPHPRRMSAVSWLRPGGDHQLAATRYAGHQSATERANGKAAMRTALDLLMSQQPCPSCGGSGGHTVDTSSGGVSRQHWQTCSSCRGSGRQ